MPEHTREWIEDEPQDREGQPCWCTDYHLEFGLNLTYCPRHGRDPDPELAADTTREAQP